MSIEDPAVGARRAAGMSAAATSAAIGLSKSTVLRRVRAGLWPGCKSGRKWLVSTLFVTAAAEQLAASPHFDLEAFAAEWMARGAASAPGPRAEPLAPLRHIAVCMTCRPACLEPAS